MPIEDLRRATTKTYLVLEFPSVNGAPNRDKGLRHSAREADIVKAYAAFRRTCNKNNAPAKGGLEAMKQARANDKVGRPILLSWPFRRRDKDTGKVYGFAIELHAMHNYPEVPDEGTPPTT